MQVRVLGAQNRRAQALGMCSNTFSWIFCNFSFFDIFSTSNQKFINIFATSLLSSGSKNLVNAFGSRSKKYRKMKNDQKSMKMCSNTYLMPMLSNFELLTPLHPVLGKVKVREAGNPRLLAKFRFYQRGLHMFGEGVLHGTGCYGIRLSNCYALI